MKSQKRFLTLAGASAVALTLSACGGTPSADSAESPATQTTTVAEADASGTSSAAPEGEKSEKGKGDFWLADGKAATVKDTIKVTGDEPDAVAEGKLDVNKDAEPLEKVGDREEEVVALVDDKTVLVKSVPSLKGAKEPNDCQLILRTIGGEDKTIQAPDGQGRLERTCGEVSVTDSHVTWAEMKQGDEPSYVVFAYDRKTGKVDALGELEGLVKGNTDEFGAGPVGVTLEKQGYFSRPTKQGGPTEIAFKDLSGDGEAKSMAPGVQPLEYGGRIGIVQHPVDGEGEESFGVMVHDDGDKLTPVIAGNMGTLVNSPVADAAPDGSVAMVLSPEGESTKIALFDAKKNEVTLFDAGEKLRPHEVSLTDDVMVFTGGSGSAKDFVFDRASGKLYSVDALESGASAFAQGKTIGWTVADDRDGRDFGRVQTATWKG